MRRRFQQTLASVLGRARLPRSSEPAPSFESDLLAAEEERHAAIRERAASASHIALLTPPMPLGFRAEDFVDVPGGEGFLPLPQAAKQMGVSESEIVELVAHGVLEARGEYVRPALVSRVAVKS